MSRKLRGVPWLDVIAHCELCSGSILLKKSASRSACIEPSGGGRLKSPVTSARIALQRRRHDRSRSCGRDGEKLLLCIAQCRKSAIPIEIRRGVCSGAESLATTAEQRAIEREEFSMTRYGVRISFDDEEMKTLKAAVAHYLEVCRREIEKGATVPFYAHTIALTRFPTIRKMLRKQSPNLALYGTEISVLKAALASYLGLCEREIASGAAIPFIADRATATKISARLSEELTRAIMDVEEERTLRGKPEQ
jgi:hypothetical protein